MTAILEIPEVRERVSPLSVEEYHRLGELNENGRRTELIRGIVIEKISKSPLHRLLCSRLYKILSANRASDYGVWKEEPLTLRDSEPEPDISVTRGAEDAFKDRHPSTAELVIEVAVSSALSIGRMLRSMRKHVLKNTGLFLRQNGRSNFIANRKMGITVK